MCTSSFFAQSQNIICIKIFKYLTKKLVARSPAGYMKYIFEVSYLVFEKAHLT